MGLTRCVALGLALAACSAKGGSEQIDAPTQTGCTTEADCSAPTRYCEPSSATCVECRFSAHCATSNRVCDEQVCRTAHSCAELEAELPGLPSGVYRVDVDGDGALAPIDVFCEMTVDGGGWTLVQRTRWSWSASQALHTGFDAWYEQTIGNAGPGSVFRLAGVYWPAVATTGELMVSHRIRTTTGAACNPLWYVGTGATLTIDPEAKTAVITGLSQSQGLVARDANGTAELSTTDSGPATNCTSSNLGVPWFYGSCCSTCPTYQGSYWTDEPHPMASYTSVADVLGMTEIEACVGQPIQVDENTGSYRGIDTMEIYLR